MGAVVRPKRTQMKTIVSVRYGFHNGQSENRSRPLIASGRSGSEATMARNTLRFFRATLAKTGLLPP